MNSTYSRGLLAAFFVLVSSPAFAQGEIAFDALYKILQPYLLAIVSVVAAAIVGWLAELLRRKFNLDIEASHRDALQTALANAAGLLIARAGSAFAGRKMDVKNAALADAVNYALQAVPDAIRYFGVTPESLAEKIKAKLPQVAPRNA